MSVFHPFVRLPAELRLQIWRAACVEASPSDGRLQYVTDRDGQAVPLPCKWRQSRGEVSLAAKNRSAYLIDGGLWKACKESREVIAKHSHFYDWVRIQKQAVVEYQYFMYCPADWAGEDESPHPAIIDTCGGEEECRMLVYPSKDIFCIQSDDWLALRRECTDPGLEMSFLRYNGDLSQTNLDKLRVRNIALEFHRSWLVDIPPFIYYYYGEHSARGYFSYVLYLYWRSPRDLDGLWIIDKETKWFRCLSKSHGTVYRDCDAEYVEVEWSDVIQNADTDGIVDFMSKIEDWLLHAGDLESSDRQSNPDVPGPKDMCRLLVRRDREVKDPKINQDIYHNGYGWVFKRHDDSDDGEDSECDGDLEAGSHRDW